MFVQIVTFDGPRGPELVAASDRAGRERISPLIEANEDLKRGLLGGIRALSPDGGEVFIGLGTDREVFDTLRDVIMNSELLPGEDPALLPGPSSVEYYQVDTVMGPISTALQGDVR
mgnify:CR=1 FL=1